MEVDKQGAHVLPQAVRAKEPLKRLPMKESKEKWKRLRKGDQGMGKSFVVFPSSENEERAVEHTVSEHRYHCIDP